MTKKKFNIPFVSNTPDDMHCVPAVFRMVHKYFLKDDISWEEIDKLLHVVPGKGTWTFVGEMEFAKKGIEILNIEPIDYKRLHEEGTEYLRGVVSEDTAKYYIERSNLNSVLGYIPQYLGAVRHENRRASIEEILDHLRQGDLIAAEVNSNILNDKPGFNLHFVLLYDYDGENIILHDPGLPPIKARKITIAQFKKCWNFPGSNGGITIFTKK